MTNLMKKFEKWIMSYTYSERRTKQLFMFNDELRHYSAMDKDELQFEYINCKTEYEHKAIIFTVTVVISAVFFSKRLFTTLNEYIMYNNNPGVWSQDAYIIYFTLISALCQVKMPIFDLFLYNYFIFLWQYLIKSVFSFIIWQCEH